jgi:hypothetical protein
LQKLERIREVAREELGHRKRNQRAMRDVWRQKKNGRKNNREDVSRTIKDERISP